MRIAIAEDTGEHARSLAEGRAANYLKAADARVALVSISRSATRKTRARDTFDGVQAQLGLDP